MKEYLPDNCFHLLDKLAKAFDESAEIGFSVSTTRLGNRFNLALRCNKHIYDMNIYYNKISLPNIKKLFNEKYPDFLLKPTYFIPASKFYNEYGIDKELLAKAVFNGFRSTLKSVIRWTNDGASICLDLKVIYKPNDNVLIQNIKTKTFKSFSEFLIWLDVSSF